MTLKRYLGLGRETGFGNAVASTRYIETVAKLSPDQGFIIPDPICDPSHSKFRTGRYRIKGSVGSFYVTPDNIGEMIEAVMGNAADNVQANGALYDHTMITSNDLDSYTLRIGAEIGERVLPGMLLEKLAFKLMHGENLQATADWVGPGNAEATNALASLSRANLSALQPFVYYETTGNVWIGGGDKSATVYDLELMIENNIPYERSNLSSRYVPYNRRGARKITGSISAYFTELAEYTRFIAGSSFAIDVILHRSTGEELEFNLPKCVYLRDVAHPVQPMSDMLTIDAPFQAFYDSTLTSELSVRLRNAVSGAYTG